MSASNNRIEIYTQLLGSENVVRALAKMSDFMDKLASGALTADEAQKGLTASSRELAKAMQKSAQAAAEDTAATKANTEAHGVNIRCNVRVESIVGGPHVTGVRIINETGTSELVDADIVLVGIGVAPATDWLADSTLTGVVSVMVEPVGACSGTFSHAAADDSSSARPARKRNRQRDTMKTAISLLPCSYAVNMDTRWRCCWSP